MTSDVAVVILAGGQGTRIGGRKPLRLLGGERLIDRALVMARQWSDCVAVSVRNPLQLGTIAVPIILDPAEVEGPLSGLVAGLHFARDTGRRLLLTIPADMPFLPEDLLERLSRQIDNQGCAVAASGDELHPVCALWDVTRSLERLDAYLASGRRSLKGFAEIIGSARIDWPGEPEDPFFNVNDLDDLAKAERRSGD